MRRAGLSKPAYIYFLKKESNETSPRLQTLFIRKLWIKMGRQMPASILEQPFRLPHHLLHFPPQLGHLLKRLHHLILVDHPVEGLPMAACNTTKSFLIQGQFEVLQKRPHLLYKSLALIVIEFVIHFDTFLIFFDFKSNCTRYCDWGLTPVAQDLPSPPRRRGNGPECQVSRR